MSVFLKGIIRVIELEIKQVETQVFHTSNHKFISYDTGE